MGRPPSVTFLRSAYPRAIIDDVLQVPGPVNEDPRFMHIFRCGLWFVLQLAASGCGISIPFPSLPPPPSEEIRTDLGEIAVRVTSDLPRDVVLQMPPRSACEALWRGEVYGFLLGLLGIEIEGFGVLATLPLGMIIGPIWGLLASPSGEEVEKAKRAIESALVHPRVTDYFRARLLGEGRHQTTHSFVSEEKEPQSRHLLEIQIVSAGVFGSWGFDPDLHAFLRIRTRLIRSADDAVLYESCLAYVSRPARFLEWGAKEAQLLTRELSRSADWLSQRIIEELCLLYLPRRAR